MESKIVKRGEGNLKFLDLEDKRNFKAGNDEGCKEIRTGQIDVGILRVEECRPDECDSHEDMGYGFL